MNNKDGVIGTFLSIATLIAITIFTFVTSSINTNLSLKQTRSSNADEIDKTATVSATPTISSPTATPAVTCRQDQSNPYVTICVTPTPTTNLTVTPTPIGRRVTMGNPNGVDIDLNIKLKLQGIVTKPEERFNKLNVKVTIVDTVLTTAGFRVGTNEAEFVATDGGIFSGTVKFSNVAARDGYYILIKGPKHIQKRVCNRSATESYPGEYDCKGTLSLASGNNVFDLAGVYMMSGDLPIQDGVINTADFGNIINTFGRVDYASLRDADVNLDGAINSQDYSLIMQTLRDTDGIDQK